MIAAAGLNVFMNGAAEAGAQRLPWAEADDDGRSFGGLDSRLVRAHVRMTLAYLLTWVLLHTHLFLSCRASF